MSESWRTDTRGLTIQGASGGGKTTTGRALHYRYPGPSILFDLDEEPAFGREVGSVAELADALESGSTEIVVRGGRYAVQEPDLFPEVVRFLMDVGDSLRETNSQMQFIMGECQDLQSKWVTVAMKRFRKRNIKPVAETQDPVSLSKRVRTQAEYQGWCSPPRADQVDSLRGTSWPIDLLQQLDEYDCLILGERWEPVARFRAGGEYVAE